jgi:hypothetical protein
VLSRVLVQGADLVAQGQGVLVVDAAPWLLLIE